MPTNEPRWTFTITPYVWLPSINATMNYRLPPALGGRLPTDVSADPGDYLPNLHLATMIGAEAQHDRFSVLTDFLYVSEGVGDTHIESLDFLGLSSHPISRSLQRHTSTSLQATIWTLAGGYTVVRGEWGNFDVLAGLRLLNVNASLNYDVALRISGPRGDDATFGGLGSISGTQTIWNGIGGFRGRFRLADSGFFIPYYFDIGGGGSQPTWQIASGVGYQAGWAGVALTYRYLSFEQGTSALVRHLALGGPMLAVNLSF